MNASVIVLSYRPGDWLADCLASVAGQADEVVLVDNGSAGYTASEIGRDAGVTVVPSAVNLGFAGGVNLGLRKAKGQIVALLNDDAIASPGWLLSAQEQLSEPDVAAITPKVLRAGWYREVVLDDAPHPAPGDSRTLGRMLRSVAVGGKEVIDRLLGVGVHQVEHDQAEPSRVWRWTAPGRPFYIPVPGPGSDASVLIDGQAPPPGPLVRLLNKSGGYLQVDGVLGDHGDESPDDGRWDVPGERFFASGTALVARADTFALLGGLAEPMFAYYEDADWSWRARLAGMRILYDPSATVEHRHSATSGGISSPAVRRLAERNRLLCLVRNAPAGVVAGGLRRVAWPGPSEQSRAALLRQLPWAMRSRRQLAGSWRVRPSYVWSRWAGADHSWDTSPARPAAGA